MPQRHIRSLDTLRGFAALGVTLYHARVILGAPAMLPHAYLLVDFFFVLSGLVIYRSYADRLESPGALLAFLHARLARVGPLYLAATLLGAILLSVQLKASSSSVSPLAEARAFGFNMVGLPDLFGPPLRDDLAAFPFVNPAWSIAWEGVVSILFGLWMLSKRRAVAAISLICCSMLIACTWRSGGFDFGWQRASFLIGGLRAFAGFALGVGCAKWLGSARRPTGGWAWLGLSTLILPVAYILFVGRTIYLAEAACIFVVFPLATVSAASVRSPLLENRLGDFLGNTSYASYMLHGLVIEAVHALTHRAGLMSGGLAGPVNWVLLSLAMPLTCWAAWRAFERPTQRLLLVHWSKRAPMPAFPTLRPSPV